MPETIQAISLWQPWAQLWAHGVKTIETRSWPLFGSTPRTLAVHAAKRWTPAERELCKREPFKSALAELGYPDPNLLPFGAILGLVTVVRVYQFHGLEDLPPEPERSFGDYRWGRYGWVTTNHRPFMGPIYAKGAQGVFGWTPTDPPQSHAPLAAPQALPEAVRLARLDAVFSRLNADSRGEVDSPLTTGRRLRLELMASRLMTDEEAGCVDPEPDQNKPTPRPAIKVGQLTLFGD